MSQKRPLIIASWTILGFLVWDALACGIVFGLMYLNNERGIHVPVWIVPLVNWGNIVGMVIVPATIVLLGLRGKLPGTSSGR